MAKPLHIGVIAGEASGDVLAAGLIRELKQLYPDAVIDGIGGQHMIAAGLKSHEDINALSVMGLVEVVKHLPSLLGIRKRILQHFLSNPPDVFIGVDAPDFNLPVEAKLKQAGIKTVHYVSPTVWAWREKRIHKIAKATNLVLGIFPFEKTTYDKYGYHYQYVGHTLADEIPIKVDQEAVRKKLAIETNKQVLALLPGSRAKEIENLLDVFLDTAQLYNKHQEILVIIPAANQARKQQIETALKQKALSIEVQVTQAAARDVMMASDLILLASGTASLEAMLCKRPMVVAYKMSYITYKMMERLYIPKYFALPNILANELLVPEFLQQDVNPENLCKHLILQSQNAQEGLIEKFEQIHRQLKCDADKQAALAIKDLMESE
ncbi:lipid-A-disaccharide synthase [Glaciecola sp. 1036]|uniref:lipid-A-disaccharide synthase n=1 Tax=Alteromonadaceae TaxID=72275 RepID=UPI003D03DB18